MADTKFSDLTTLTGAGVDSASDFFVIVDTSATVGKKITPAQLFVIPIPSTLTIVPATNVSAQVIKANASQTVDKPLQIFYKSDGTTEIGRLHFDLTETGGYSIFLGYQSGKVINVTGVGSEGKYNTFVGHSVGQAATTAYYNTAMGTDTLAGLTTGFHNNAFGSDALLVCTTGNKNNAFGFNALGGVISGASNCAFGTNALILATSSNNAAFGDSTGSHVTSGQYHSMFGSGAGNGTTTAHGQCFFGINAGATLTTGSYNTIIGYLADATTNSITNSIAIGANASVAGSNLAVIGATGTAVKLGINMTTPAAWLHLPAGTATASTAPLKFTSGTNNTTAEAGAMEYNGTNLFFTRAGTTREGVITQSAVTTEVLVSDTSVTVNIGGTTYKLLAKV